MAENAIVTTNAGEMIDPAKIALIKNTVAKGATDDEFGLLCYKAKILGLDPLAGQIYFVKRGDGSASYIVGRDGFLTIAHRSLMFDGMESGASGEPGQLVAWCKVFRKDMSHPFHVEVHEREYSTGLSTWKKMPRTMLIKVAESQCLRKAFSISGVYSPEEIDEVPREVQPCSCEPRMRQEDLAVLVGPDGKPVDVPAGDIKEAHEIKKQPPVSPETATKMEKAGFTPPAEKRQPGIPADVKVTKMSKPVGACACGKDLLTSDVKKCEMYGITPVQCGACLTKPVVASSDIEEMQKMKAGGETHV